MIILNDNFKMVFTCLGQLPKFSWPPKLKNVIYERLFYIKNSVSSVSNYPHSTMSVSRAFFSQRPKCANLAQAGTNAYETDGNRPVNLFHT